LASGDVDQLIGFANGSIAERWEIARRMMAAKQLTAAVDTPEFVTGFKALGEAAKAAEGTARLLAIELVVRLSSFVKTLKAPAALMLIDALAQPLPPLSLAVARTLPPGAKPAEVRENVALALAYASGDWVAGYVVDALAREDKSHRCRLELVRQLAIRVGDFDQWMALLAAKPWSQIIGGTATRRVGPARLREVLSAITDIVKEKRSDLHCTKLAGKELAALCRAIVPVSARSAIPPKLSPAGVSVAQLLDELFSVNLTLIAEPEAYAPIDVLNRWWEPLPLPEPVQTACRPIADKMIAAITLRARMGQRSEALAARLAQALSSKKAAQQLLLHIADTEHLAPDIDDWLRDRVRAPSGTTEALKRVLGELSANELMAEIAPLVLEAHQLSSSESNEPYEGHQGYPRSIVDRLNLIASQFQIEVVGRIGDVVEYAPNAHKTLSDLAPANHQVRVIQPMVVRRRQDGSLDILQKAIVGEL
jgi:hypothetical protein